MKVICSTRISRDPYDGTMSNPTFDLVQWPYPELVKQLQQNILNLLETVQARNGISLERLEGVTIVPNLIEALRTFDAGYPSDHAAAMRDAVMGRMITALRDGRVQGHVFLPIDVAFQIALEGAPARRTCEYMLVHECTHVQDLQQVRVVAVYQSREQLLFRFCAGQVLPVVVDDRKGLFRSGF